MVLKNIGNPHADASQLFLLICLVQNKLFVSKNSTLFFYVLVFLHGRAFHQYRDQKKPIKMYAELNKLLREEYRTLEDFRAKDKAEKMAAATVTANKEASCSCSAAAEACSSSENCKEPELS